MSHCTCLEPGFCPRHDCTKTGHLWQLCQQREDYFQLWEEGRGPGQAIAVEEPPIIRKAANFGQAAMRHALDCWQHVDEQIYEERLAICRACPSCDLARMVCRQRTCGCYLERKARWRSARCPLRKWPLVD